MYLGPTTRLVSVQIEYQHPASTLEGTRLEDDNESSLITGLLI
jgi:hypothetical protein